MSGVRASVLLIGLFAVAVVVLVGASDVARSSEKSGVKSACCAKNAGAQAATSHESCPKASASTDAGKGCPMSSSHSKGGCSQTCAKPSKTADVESIRHREGKTVVLAGRYVCGTCELGVGDDCQPAFRTADGKNYLLIRNNLSQQLRNDARDKDVEIVSRVKKLDGVKYLEVEVVRTAS